MEKDREEDVHSTEPTWPLLAPCPKVWIADGAFSSWWMSTQARHTHCQWESWWSNMSSWDKSADHHMSSSPTPPIPDITLASVTSATQTLHHHHSLTGWCLCSEFPKKTNDRRGDATSVWWNQSCGSDLRAGDQGAGGTNTKTQDTKAERHKTGYFESVTHEILH